MDVRELTAADRPSATTLWSEVGLTRPWNDPGADFDRAVVGPTSCVLGAFDDGLAATLHGRPRRPPGLGVLPGGRPGEARGRCRQAHDARSRALAASSAGAVKINLMVRHGNAAALGFYERLGYEDAETTVLARWLDDPA